MDDNENIIDFQKMNFSPFTTQFTGLPTNSSLHQFTTAKFAQNLTSANGQVVGLVSGTDGNVQFIRSIDGTANFQNQAQQNATANLSQAQTFILPITIPGDKPGEAQQTVQIQVLNPNQIQQTPKFQNFPMQFPIQGFQQPTVLTVSVPQDGDMLNHGLPEGVTVLAAIQPQDLPMFAQSAATHTIQPQTTNASTQIGGDLNDINITAKEDNREMITIKQEPIWQHSTITASANDINEYIARQTNLQQFLKFDNDNLISIKRDEMTDTIEEFQQQEKQQQQAQQHQPQQQQQQIEEPESTEVDSSGKTKKKRKYKKKPPKPKPPKPGQVQLATALDGTILFCCPECQLAYPEKTELEQHLSVHKIERRYICDICGAGLKRKEHLERHKLGHSPERPHICSVCMKGFKRKEHLNLHFVIHSGDKSEICGECGKGFYRKDHLRKHAKSHATKRAKEQAAAVQHQLKQQQQPKQQPPQQLLQNSANITTATTIQQSPSAQQQAIVMTADSSTTPNTENIITATDSLLHHLQQQQLHLHPDDRQTLCLPVTIHVPTSDNTTVPVQIQIPQIITTSGPDGTTNTVILHPSASSALSTTTSTATTHLSSNGIHNNNNNNSSNLNNNVLSTFIKTEPMVP